MSDIFGGVQPPAWLQELTIPKQQGELGATLGLALGAGVLALQPNDEGTGLKGLKKGMAEARMAEADPNWKVKQKALEGQVVSNWARAATEWQSFDATNRDMAQWTTTDLPALSKYQESLKTNPDTTPPVMISGKGQQALQQIETSRLRKSTLDFKRDQAENMFDIQQQRADNASAAAKIAVNNAKKFTDLLATVTDPAVQARIQGMMKNGAPTPEAWDALAQAEKVTPKVAEIRARGEEERKTEGVKQENRIELEDVRADNREDLAKLTGQQKQDFEKARQADRVALEQEKQRGRVDIEKMKELSRTGPNGKPLSRMEFINRHFNTVYSNLRKDAPAGQSPSETAAQAERVLSGVYYRVDKDTPKATTSKAAAAEPSKPAASTATDSDPLGILK